MISDSQRKTGAFSWVVYELIFRYVRICLHARASMHIYIYACVCMVTNVFEYILQYVMFSPFVAILVVLFALYTSVQFLSEHIYIRSVFQNHMQSYFYLCNT